jgi:Tfp pilus assembly protein PilF
MLESSKNIILLGLCALVLGGCVSMQNCSEGSDEIRLLRTPTEFMINNGIKYYEDGNYSAAQSILQNLESEKDATKAEKILAYKYLAFIHCISPTESKELREKMCRESFKKAFELNPNFNLSPAEAGHPVWGPIFSSVKNTPKK